MSKFFNVLMADDDHDDHQFFREALRAVKVAGFNAHEIVSLSSVYNGVQALDYLYRRGNYKTSKDDSPDFVILDINMPIQDGFSVLKVIRKDPDFKNIPVYILTTSRTAEDKKKCQELGCSGFFSKPPKIEELSNVIEKMLNSEPE